jgi:hypothetical protein
MTKKVYDEPSIKVVRIRQKLQLLAGSVDKFNMNTKLQEKEEVEEGW